jgi:hypothetical protein
VRTSTELALRLTAEREALASALRSLDDLEGVAGSLAEAEAQLLDTSIPNEQLTRIRDELRARRAQRDVLSREIAARLVESRFAEQFRLGSLNPWGGVTTRGRAAMTSMSARSFENASLSFGRAAGISGNNMSVFGGSRSVSVENRIDPFVWLERLLPWPPPDPSAHTVIERALPTCGDCGLRTLGDLDDRMRNALASAGYHGLAYFGVPDGFAIVTRIEQTDSEARPLVGEARWAATVVAMRSFSLAEYLRALLTAPPGYFRVIAFVASSRPFTFSGDRAKLSVIERWSRSGSTGLPEELRREPLTEAHRVTALVYEFEKRNGTERPEVFIPGRWTAVQHLQNTALATTLN